jgi:hypothetical protein
MNLNADKILSAGLATQTLEIEKFGGTVTISELSMAQVNVVAEIDDVTAANKYIIRHGLRDPELNDEQIEQLFETGSPAAIVQLVTAISEMSRTAAVTEEDQKETDRGF